MTHRRLAGALAALAVAFGSTAAGHALGARGAAGAGGAGEPAAGPATLEAGRRLYRKYCGQCHALRAANAAGFGSKPKLGQEGGPSFNTLRVPFALTVWLLTQSSAGHERIAHKLKWTEVRDVATFIASSTKSHSILAQPIDG
jgi:mono/diheme cytochrome c family protein